jgi:hypothetical protein
MDTAQQATITAEELQALRDALRRRGYRIVGPTLRDQAIVYDDIACVGELPKGWSDEQAGGHYRLARRDDDAFFGYAVGPHSWKKFLHPPVLRLADRAPERRDGRRPRARTGNAVRLHRRARLRIARDRHPRPSASRRTSRRYPLPGSA